MREIKRYERGYDKGEKQKEGTLRLASFDVLIDESEILLQIDDFTKDDLNKHFDIKTGEWSVEDGWVVGKNPDMCPGMIVSKADFFGPVMFEIRCKMIAPSTHDVNIMIHGEWDDEIGKENPAAGRRTAYVTGLEAFWHGNIGFEKSPDYKLTVATQLFEFDPEKEHILRLGNLGEKLFVQVDGQLCLEIKDPAPIDIYKYGKVGVEAFASWFKFKDMKVYSLKFEKAREYYCPEF